MSLERTILLKSLTPGEPVALTTSRGRAMRLTITRVTRTQVLIGEDRYDRETGAPIGSVTYSHSHVRPWTAEDDARKGREQLAATLLSAAQTLAVRVQRFTMSNGTGSYILAEDVEQAKAALAHINDAIKVLDPNAALFDHASLEAAPQA